MSAHLLVLAPGLMTTVQDVGRIGGLALGVPTSGALDRVALAAANLLVGNPPETAALEIAYQGPTLEVAADSVRLALAGGGAGLEILGEARREIPSGQSVTLARGTRVRIGPLRSTTTACLAVEGGISVPAIMGSRSTYVRAGLGGHEGRALAAGDRVPLAVATASPRGELSLPAIDLAAPAEIRAVLGPQDDHFTAEAIATLAAATFTVGRASDRMGLRLEGPPLAHARGFDIVSDGIAPGAIQVPGNGLPIVLGPDRQTTGGYPKIATVISADLPALGRLSPGRTIRFRLISLEEADAARAGLEAMLAGLAARLEPVRAVAVLDPAMLLCANLVSGVVDAQD